MAREMEGVEAYLELQQLQYAGRIQVHCQVPAELEEAAVLKLTFAAFGGKLYPARHGRGEGKAYRCGFPLL